ncbi:hypothetical protein CWI38_0047p0040 [Hamiltosporidium tvaerminnensis]|uniref:Uncharacterized protein n=1 Tax=Hamiltosporidium tvaerminnensis TaxID=1176355 RepID=A0A4Q9M4T3_9MICR|nr:hypothetical protein CWI38_0047p0040 [Hamiltosporidium tvaerminnensis]
MNISNMILYLRIGHNIKIMSIFLFICLFATLKADNPIVLHFYNESNEQESNLTRNKEEKECFSGFVKRRYNCFKHEECIDCINHTITNRKRFLLSFKLNNETEKRINIYIRSSLLKYSDFLYFLKSLNYIHDIKENLKLEDYVLLIHILDIFKFKKDEIFNQFVRITILSAILNNEKKISNGDLVKKITTSSSVFKSIIYEFGKIYLFDLESLFEEIPEKNIRKKIIQKSSSNFCSNKDFFYLTSGFNDETRKRIRCDIKFIYAFEKIFRLIQPHRVALYYYQSRDIVLCASLSRFCRSCEELCFYAWKDNKFLEHILEAGIFDMARILFFYDCQFSSFSEKFFEKFLSLESIYIFRCSFESTVISYTTFAYIQSLVSILNDIIKSREFSKYLYCSSNRPYKFETFDVKKIINENRNSISQEALNCTKYQIYFSYKIIIDFFVAFKLSILNLGKTEKIGLCFHDISMNELKIQSLDISNNIKFLGICKSKLTDAFLSNILLFPNLKQIKISASSLIFRKQPRSYANHLIMHELVITACKFENPNGIFEFINSMPNVKKFIFHSNDNFSFCLKIFKNNRMKLDNLEYFHIGEKGNYISDYLAFTDLSSIIILKLIVPSQAGSLHKLFFNKRFNNLKWLAIDSFKIESMDKKSLANCITLRVLAMYHSKCKKIYFSELFDRKKEYSLEKIILRDIPIRNLDIVFISNLKHLKVLGIYGAHLYFNLINFFRLFSASSFKQKIKLYFDGKYSLNESIHHFKELSGIEIENKIVWYENDQLIYQF